MSDYDEKVAFSQENRNTLFRELANDPSDHTSGRLARRYAGPDGVLDAASLKKLLDDYKTVLGGSSGGVRKQDSVVIPNETTAEQKAREQRQAAEALEKWTKRQPKLVTFLEVQDQNVLARLFPTSLETSQNSSAELKNSSMADELLKDRAGNLEETEQYTWDICLVFKLGEDKPLKFQLVEPPTEEELRENPRAPKKRIPVDTTEKELFRGGIASTLDALERAGLKLFLFLSVQRDEVYCFVGADERRLAREADRINMSLKLSKDPMIAHGKRVGLPLAKRTDVPDEHWENIYAPFRDFKEQNDPREDLYVKYEEGAFHPKTPFHHVNRLKLIESIIKTEDILGGAGLTLRRKIRDARHPLTAYFPLQHYPAQKKLRAEMMSFKALWFPPQQHIVSYFGEQIALYFVFLSTYIKWLLLASVVGCAFALYQLGLNKFDAEGLPAFGIFMVAWSTIFLEHLKRKVAQFRVEFGMTNFLEQETVRAEFEGEWVLSPVSGKLEEVFPFWEYAKRKFFSITAVVCYIGVALGAVVGIFVLRAALANTSLPTGAILAIASGINAFQIQAFNQVYARLSARLNDYENHRTDSQYENSLIGKAFFFKVINSFSTFIYIGYVKMGDARVRFCKGSWPMTVQQLDDTETPIAQSWTPAMVPIQAGNMTEGLRNAANVFNTYGPDYRGDCFGELAYQLFIIFGVMIFVNNTIELLGPIVGKFLQNRAQTKDPNATNGKDGDALANAEKKDVEAPPMGPVNEKLAKITDSSRQSDAENEFEYPQYEGTFADYDELIIQFGFVVLFVVVFPAAPGLALLNNLIEFRLDAAKILGFTRRPHPKGAYDMGTWFNMLDLISWVMVISNTGLIVFSSYNFSSRLLPEERWITFVCVEHILIGIKLTLQFLVPDVPLDVEERIARQDVIRQTLVDPNY